LSPDPAKSLATGSSEKPCHRIQRKALPPDPAKSLATGSSEKLCHRIQRKALPPDPAKSQDREFGLGLFYLHKILSYLGSPELAVAIFGVDYLK
jgi:hypothetical protein